jgi:hypothetical protein
LQENLQETLLLLQDWPSYCCCLVVRCSAVLGTAAQLTASAPHHSQSPKHPSYAATLLHRQHLLTQQQRLLQGCQALCRLLL